MMEDREFDEKLVAAVFELAAEQGWHRVRVAEAARRANLPLDRARARCPHRAAALMRFGRMADQSALVFATEEGSPRDRLFDLLMQRFEVMQPHRPGILAVLRALPADPPLAALLACATRGSMAWMLGGAGISSTGISGHLRVSGLVAVWMYTLRAWSRDTSEDLTATMAALDRALTRAGQAAEWLGSRRAPAAPDAEPDEPELPFTDPGAMPEDPASPPG